MRRELEPTVIHESGRTFYVRPSRNGYGTDISQPVETVRAARRPKLYGRSQAGYETDWPLGIGRYNWLGEV